MIYVVVYPEFGPETRARIDRFRQRYEPRRARLIPPHLTLVFGLPAANPSAFIEFCRETVLTRHAIQIALDDANIVHDPTEATYKLCLSCREGRSELIDLHTTLNPVRPGDERRPNIVFDPHMTIATDPDRESVAGLQSTALALLPIRGRVSTVNVVDVTDRALTQLAELRLRGSGAQA